jgi:phosphate transport system substrate-binding protein
MNCVRTPAAARFAAEVCFFLSAVAASAPAVAQEVKGTGATFPAKVYQQWAQQHERETGAKVQYIASGSSAGVRQMVARAVDFGATDVPLSAEELEKRDLFQFPTMVGGIVPVVNLPGAAGANLRLDGPTLAKLFAGRIERWNDREIAALNPNVALPNLRVTRVVRADGSGSTQVFLSYLKAVGAAADGLPAPANSVSWPGAVSAVEGSRGVTQAVTATSGAISYVSSDYLGDGTMRAVRLRNKQGDFVAPSVAGYMAAVRSARLFNDDLNPTPMIDLPGHDVWPIVTATYVVVDHKPASAQRAAQTIQFFYRAFMNGDKAVAGTGFAPLPLRTQARVVGLISALRTRDGERIPTLGSATNEQTAPAGSSPQ